MRKAPRSDAAACAFAIRWDHHPTGPEQRLVAGRVTLRVARRICPTTSLPMTGLLSPLPEHCRGASSVREAPGGQLAQGAGPGLGLSLGSSASRAPLSLTLNSSSAGARRARIDRDSIEVLHEYHARGSEVGSGTTSVRRSDPRRIRYVSRAVRRTGTKKGTRRKCNECLDFLGSGGGIRTPDPRIMIPLLFH